MGLGFDFEPRNFGLGVLAGWASAFALYQARQIVQSMRSSAETRASQTRASITRTAEGRYSRELIQFCETNHLMGERIALSKILVEPRFIAQSPFAAPPDDDVRFDVFRVVPRVHDHPYLHAIYNIESAGMDDLGYGDRAIALLGNRGTGRTTALQAIALWNMGLIDFIPPKDSVAIRLEDEERALKAEERAARIKDRMTIEERARERLAEEQKDPGLKNQPDSHGRMSPLRRQTPVYVHLANVHPTSRAFGRQFDPAEPLLRGIQAHLGSVTSKTFPRRFYERLNQGRLLLLIDGLDNLPESQQERYIPWLAALLEQYRHNYFIVTGQPYGIGGLTSAGLTPVYLRPWDDGDTTTAARLWGEHWRTISKRREEPNEDQIAQAATDTRGLSPLDVCLKIRATYAEQHNEEAVPGDWMRWYLEDLGLTAEQIEQAARAAALQLDAGYITEAGLVAVASGEKVKLPVTGPLSAPPPTSAAEVDAIFSLEGLDDDEDVDALFADDGDQDVDALFDGNTNAVMVEDAPAPATPASERPASSPTARAQSQMLAALTRLGLISRYVSDREGGRYCFRQSPVTAYLASLSLSAASSQQMAEKAMLPAWDMALGYASAHTSVDAAVRARLAAHPDMLYNHILDTARWLAYTGQQFVEWRGNLMKQLGGLFIAPAQFTLMRERAAAATAGTRDKGTAILFQRGLKSNDPQIRRLSALMLGYFRDEASIEHLAVLTNDEHPDVSLGAAIGLSGVRTEDAYEEMAVAITSGPEPVRQVIAEAFAAIPEPGYPTLYEAASDEDLLLRRYAIFGLRRVNTPWALLTVYRAFLEERQFYVKSAAQQAFLDMQNNVVAQALRHYPQPESIPWLLEMAGADPQAMENPELVLIDGLTQGGPTVQSLSATAIGQLGMTTRVGDLYQALLYRDQPVRDAAHRALTEIQVLMGESLPAPN